MTNKPEYKWCSDDGEYWFKLELRSQANGFKYVQYSPPAGLPDGESGYLRPKPCHWCGALEGEEHTCGRDV